MCRSYTNEKHRKESIWKNTIGGISMKRVSKKDFELYKSMGYQTKRTHNGYFIFQRKVNRW